jgi:hypothetical protein
MELQFGAQNFIIQLQIANTETGFGMPIFKYAHQTK